MNVEKVHTIRVYKNVCMIHEMDITIKLNEIKKLYEEIIKKYIQK